jgi:hypothetical protein
MGTEPVARRAYDRDRHDDTGWISFGAFLIIIAVIYLTTPGIVPELKAFLLDFKMLQNPQGFWWPMPSTSHPVVYNAAERFCFYFGAVQVGVLALRFALRSSIRGKAETVSGIVFWLGSGYSLSLLSQGTLSWFEYVGVWIVVVGVSIAVRGLALILVRRG